MIIDNENKIIVEFDVIYNEIEDKANMLAECGVVDMEESVDKYRFISMF